MVSSKKSKWAKVGITAVTLVGLTSFMTACGSNDKPKSSGFGTELSSSKKAHKSSKKDKDSKKSSKKEQSKKKDKTSESSKKASSSSSSVAPRNPSVAGMGFQITPVLFNGEDAGDAMSAQRAPQNLIHDGINLGYFQDDTYVRYSGVSAYMYAATSEYTWRDGKLIMTHFHIPLRVVNGAIQTTRWDEKDRDGNTITYEIKALADAREQVESHKNPDEDEAGSSTSGVDVHNLTTEQMQHWVQSWYDQDGGESHDLTFKQGFVNGYAEVYATDRGDSGDPITTTFRVNAEGYLEVKMDESGDYWRVISRSYH